MHSVEALVKGKISSTEVLVRGKISSTEVLLRDKIISYWFLWYILFFLLQSHGLVHQGLIDYVYTLIPSKWIFYIFIWQIFRLMLVTSNHICKKYISKYEIIVNVVSIIMNLFPWFSNALVLKMLDLQISTLYSDTNASTDLVA